MTPFEEAVAAGGPLVAAWDYEDNDSQRVVLFKVGPSGWVKLAETDVPTETREAMQDRLSDRGVRVGMTYAGSGYVWVADDLGFGVWNETKQTGSGKVASPAVAKIHVIYEGGAPDRRAVAIEMRSGGSEVVAEERSLWPSMDVTYDAMNLELETMWAHYLSLHLALWHLVPLVNDISSYSIDGEMSVTRSARALAKNVSKLPDIGTFDPPSEELGPGSRTKSRVLAVVPAADEPAMRVLELRVTLPSGTTSTAILRRGTNAQIAAFLRRVTTSSAVLTAVSGLLD